MRPISDATNIEANGWKSKDHCNMMVKRIADFFIERGPPSWTQNIPKLFKFVERFEEVFNSAKDEAEYIARISTKMNPVREPLQSDESNLLPSKASASGELTLGRILSNKVALVNILQGVDV
ncbi:hypothetical protein GmHk_04G010355 [Glycine max]|nr:hypothetical protein GmHk_04G010355 [Glycine max]